jgi:hypothetical protein
MRRRWSGRLVRRLLLAGLASLTVTAAVAQAVTAPPRCDDAGTQLLNRLIFHHNPDRTVRQYWETSADSGKTWTPVFDGLYRKRA